MSEEFLFVEVIEPDGLCHWKMQCEHGMSECSLPEDHDGIHGNERTCRRVRALERCSS